MRRTWDALAAGETAVYVGDPGSGAEELAGLFGRLGADPRGGSCVEVGCGPGRMTGALAERFDDVIALDVSPAMLEQARAKVTAPNVRFRAVSGDRLDGVDDGRADVVVCYLVLQHLPSAQVVRSYLREFARVLAPDGEAFVQIPVLDGWIGRARRGLPHTAHPSRAAARAQCRLPRLPPDPVGARRGTRRGRSAGRRRGRGPVRVPLLPRPLPAARPRMTAAALVVYGVLLAATGVAVFRRPIVALYVFVLGLPLHNIVMSLLYGGGVRGHALDAIQAWKEILLAAALASVVVAAVRARRLPFEPGVVDWLALAYAAVVVLYALVPQSALDGHAGAKAVVYGLRHDLVLVAAYFLGRSLPLDVRRIRWLIARAAAAVAAWGLVEVYSVPIEWWRHSGAVGYFHHELGYDYHGPGGLPENFAFNTSGGLFRRLVSTFVSPLATAYMLVVALLLLASVRRLRPLAVVLAVLCGAGLLWTFSRSSIVALAVGLVVLAAARRRWWPLPAAVAVARRRLRVRRRSSTTIAPRTHWFASDLPYQVAQAKAKGPLPHGSGLSGTVSLGEPSIKSHLDSLRDGIRTVVHHPQGYGLGNAGTTAQRFGVTLKAGESNYTELGVETGLAGALLFIAWSLALFVGLVRAAWTGDRAAAAVAAALAATLALAIQTDAIGVPWLAYCLWWLAGALRGQRNVQGAGHGRLDRVARAVHERRRRGDALLHRAARRRARDRRHGRLPVPDAAEGRSHARRLRHEADARGGPVALVPVRPGRDVDATVEQAKGSGSGAVHGPGERRRSACASPCSAIRSARPSASCNGAQEPPTGVFAWDELYAADVEAAAGFYGELARLDDGSAFRDGYRFFDSGETHLGGLMKKTTRLARRLLGTHFAASTTSTQAAAQARSSARP